MTRLAEPPPETTLRNERRDFVEWHMGRPAYALWALQFDSSALSARVSAAQAYLSDLLLDGYVRQPHITLSLCGFPSLRPSLPDEFGPEAVEAQVQALQQAGIQSFDITIGGLDTFSSVPYCEVRGGTEPLLALRRALQAPDGGQTQGDYMPHVTVGLYRDAFPMPMVRERLQAFGNSEPLRVQVTGVDLLTYASAEIGGALRCRARYAFGATALQWQGDLFA